MKLSLYLYTTQTGCDSPVNQSLCDDIFAGVLEAEAEVFGHIQSGNFDMLYTVIFDQNAAEEQMLGIKRTPTLIFYDADAGQAVYKLTTREITVDNVAEVSAELFELSAAGSGGGYVTAEGEQVSTGRKDDLLELDLGGGLGFNPFGNWSFCNDIAPPWVCQTLPILLIVLLVVIVAMAMQKMLR